MNSISLPVSSRPSRFLRIRSTSRMDLALLPYCLLESCWRVHRVLESRHGDVFCRKYYETDYFSTHTSTLLFIDLPVGVSFGAIGSDEPNPKVFMFVNPRISNSPATI